MSDSQASRTSPSLLEQLRGDVPDQVAWAEFARRYGRLTRQWGRKWGLQEADADDLAQTVLARLTDRMRSFRYDPARSFRAYLKALAHYAWCDLLDAGRRPGAGGTGDSADRDRLHSVEARADLERDLNTEFDPELLADAMARVRARVEPHTWEVFRLTALEGVPGVAAAERLGLKVATVYKAKSKVQQMLRQELAGRGDS